MPLGEVNPLIRVDFVEFIVFIFHLSIFVVRILLCCTLEEDFHL